MHRHAITCVITHVSVPENPGSIETSVSTLLRPVVLRLSLQYDRVESGTTARRCLGQTQTFPPARRHNSQCSYVTTKIRGCAHQTCTLCADEASCGFAMTSPVRNANEKITESRISTLLKTLVSCYISRRFSGETNLTCDSIAHFDVPHCKSERIVWFSVE